MPRPKSFSSAQSRASPQHEASAKSGRKQRRGSAIAAARAHAEAMRQAECAAMLVAVTRLLLNMRGREYAAWLRTVADDFEETDLDEEHPDDLSEDLIRINAGGERRREDPAVSDEQDETAEPGPSDAATGRRH